MPTGKNEMIQSTIKYKSEDILAMANKYPTPFYVLDENELEQSITEFTAAFQKFLPEFQAYYAIKANHHPYIIKKVLKHKLGLDVSSSDELKLAIKFRTNKILFSGPAKTYEDLKLAIKNNKRVTINIDSFSELEKIGKISNKYKKNIRAGVRVFSVNHGTWNKFGIAMSSLKKMWQEAEKYPFIRLEGIQFHLSHNKNSEKYQKVIQELGIYLKKEFTKEMLNSIKYIDFGGGFFPDKTEGQYLNTLNIDKKSGDEEFPKYYLTESISIEKYVKDIAESINEYLKPIVNCNYYTEPGRIICTKAMHIVLRIIDKKNNKNVITDGGTNIIGWGYSHLFYFPLINLTHPSIEEKKCTIHGSLCTPKDIWGHYFYGEKIEIGDVILIPNQGAYKYTLAQNFIRLVPKVYILKNSLNKKKSS